MRTNEKWKKLVLIAPLALLGMALFVVIGGQIVLQLWNWLLPPLFGFSQIGFWQALGLLALCRILFGGFGFGGPGRSRGRRGGPFDRVSDRVSDRVAERVDERFEAMNPEERERFRQRMRERFGSGASAGESEAR